MANDFDDFPVYDKIADPNGDLSFQWKNSLATFFVTLTGYLTQTGVLLPQVTTAQRDEILNPQNGQTIYNTTLGTAQYLKEGVWTSY